MKVILVGGPTGVGKTTYSIKLAEVLGAVILDLGFTAKSQRSIFVDLANKIGVNSEIHHLSASVELRR